MAQWVLLPQVNRFVLRQPSWQPSPARARAARPVRCLELGGGKTRETNAGSSLLRRLMGLAWPAWLQMRKCTRRLLLWAAALPSALASDAETQAGCRPHTGNIYLYERYEVLKVPNLRQQICMCSSSLVQSNTQPSARASGTINAPFAPRTGRLEQKSNTLPYPELQVLYSPMCIRWCFNGQKLAVESCDAVWRWRGDHINE